LPDALEFEEVVDDAVGPVLCVVDPVPVEVVAPVVLVGPEALVLEVADAAPLPVLSEPGSEQAAT
jgi:hypothetical protein